MRIKPQNNTKLTKMNVRWRLLVCNKDKHDTMTHETSPIKITI